MHSCVKALPAVTAPASSPGSLHLLVNEMLFKGDGKEKAAWLQPAIWPYLGFKTSLPRQPIYQAVHKSAHIW